jgi:hypothetical protein
MGTAGPGADNGHRQLSSRNKVKAGQYPYLRNTWIVGKCLEECWITYQIP